MGAHATTYKVNVHFSGKKGQDEIKTIYTRFYLGVITRVLKSSSAPLEKKNELLDKIIKEYS